MSQVHKLSKADYRAIREAAQEAYMNVKIGRREEPESYTAKCWTKAVVGHLKVLGLIDFSVDLEPELEYSSVEE